MTDDTCDVEIDLQALRKTATETLREHSLPRYEDVLSGIEAQRSAVTTLVKAIQSRLGGSIDTVTSTTVRECETTATKDVGPGLQSADNLHGMLARAVLILADVYELLP